MSNAVTPIAADAAIPSLLRRCPQCSAVATCVDPDRRTYVCADPACGTPVHAAPLRCPRCLGLADRDAGSLRCRAGCPALPLPPQEPRAGWELAVAELASAYEVSDWGLDGMHTVAWDRYSTPTSRLQQRWGRPDDDGCEVRSVEGRALAEAHLNDTARIAEMSDALRAFGAAVRADPALRIRGPALRDATHVDELRRWLVLIVGRAVCIELANSIVARGGSFAGINEMLRQIDTIRTTPFGGYRHAVAFWAGDHGSTLLGDGSPLAGAGGAEATHGLPSGVRFGEIAVHPSHAASGNARNAVAWTMLQDVDSCFAAARVGGEWSEADPNDPDAARWCTGGRPLHAWEFKLVRLCDFGADVGGREWRKLTVLEAVDRVRATAVAAARDAAWGGDDAAQEAAEWGPARHLTTPQAKEALKAARIALQEALEACGLIPARPKRRRRLAPVETAHLQPLQLPRAARAHATWDLGATR